MKRQFKFHSFLLVLGVLAVSLNAKAVATVVGTEAAPRVVDLGALALPTSANYGNTFSAPTSEIFFDNYTFTLGVPASFSSVTASIDLGSFLGIKDLSARLYAGSGAFIDTTPIVLNWSVPFSPGASLTGSTTLISLSSLAAGTYTMQIRGNVFGTSGGSYSGVLNAAPVSPVPEPATYGMLLAGLGLVALASRKKNTAAK